MGGAKDVEPRSEYVDSSLDRAFIDFGLGGFTNVTEKSGGEGKKAPKIKIESPIAAK